MTNATIKEHGNPEKAFEAYKDFSWEDLENTLWDMTGYPLRMSVYQALRRSPLSYKTIGELAALHDSSFLMGLPYFGPKRLETLDAAFTRLKNIRKPVSR